MAGIAFVRPGQILLAHPTGAPMRRTWSIPKGHQDPGETALDTARRETREEVGLWVPLSLLGEPRRIKKNRKKSMVYWVVDVRQFRMPDELPLEQLQIEEVDEARFVDVDVAYDLLEKWQWPVLDEVP